MEEKQTIIYGEPVKEYMDVETGESIVGAIKTEEELLKLQEAQERKDKRDKYLKEKTEFESYIQANFGSFYFNNYMKLLTKLKNNTALLFRFLYLCTYANYDGYLKYGLNSSLYMKENDFGEVFKL